MEVWELLDIRNLCTKCRASALDFPCNDNTFGNGDVKNMKLEEEYDPLKKLAFGAVKPRVLQIDSSICYNGTDGPDTLGFSIFLIFHNCIYFLN